jgi:iron transport multicopper oxidase
MRSATAAAGLALALATTAQSAIVEHWWNISYATANPDGVSFYRRSIAPSLADDSQLYERRVIGVNGSWP